MKLVIILSFLLTGIVAPEYHDFPHKGSVVITHVTAAGFGPLNTIKGKHYENFRSGSYYMTTPKDFLVLHRLYGHLAKLDGQYWTVEQRAGTESYRFDYAVKENWNSLRAQASMVVPRGVLLYEGPTAAHGHYLGGGWQVFIPYDVLKPLLHFQQLLVSDERPKDDVMKAYDEVEKAQKELYDAFKAELDNKRGQCGL